MKTKKLNKIIKSLQKEIDSHCNVSGIESLSDKVCILSDETKVPSELSGYLFRRMYYTDKENMKVIDDYIKDEMSETTNLLNYFKGSSFDYLDEDSDMYEIFNFVDHRLSYNKDHFYLSFEIKHPRDSNNGILLLSWCWYLNKRYLII